MSAPTPAGTSLQAGERHLAHMTLPRHEVWLTSARLLWSYRGEKRWTTLPLNHTAGIHWDETRDAAQVTWGTVVLVLGVLAGLVPFVLHQGAVVRHSNAILIAAGVLLVGGVVMLVTSARTELRVVQSSGDVGLTVRTTWRRAADVEALADALSNAVAGQGAMPSASPLPSARSR